MLDTFLIFTGGTITPTGETTDKTLNNNIALKSFDFGASNNSSVSSDKPGSGSGKPSLSNFNFTKYIDNATPNLFLCCCLGEHFTTAVVTVRKSGGDQETYLTITLAEVYISSFSCNASEGSEIPFESGSLTYQSLQISYYPQATTGIEGPISQAGYDLTTNAQM